MTENVQEENLNINNELTSEKEESSKENIENLEHESNEIQEEKTLNDLPLPESSDEENESSKDDVPKWVKTRLEKKDRVLAKKETELEIYKQQLEETKKLLGRNENLGSEFNINSLEQPPEREDFDSDYDFASAVYKYENKKEHYNRYIQQQRDSAEYSERKFRENISKTKELGESKYSDFNEKISPLFREDFPSNRAMAEAIVDSKYKEDILYFLGSYSKEARKIAEMNPIQAIKEIANLERRFEDKSKNTIKKVQKVIEPITGGGSAVISDKEPDNMSDFRVWYANKYGNR